MRRHITTIALLGSAVIVTSASASPLGRALDYLSARQDPLTGMIGPAGAGQAADTAWVAMAAAAAGEQPVDWHGAGLTLNDAVGSLPADSIGDLLRLALARKAAGSRDPDMADAVMAQRSADGGFGTSQLTSWGILAYIAAAAPPTDVRVATAVAVLRGLQLADGGWAVGGATQSDAVSTATAIQALRAAAVGPADPALVAARGRLLALRDRGGTFGRAAVPTAWAALAIRALGERPDKGAWPLEGNALTALVNLQQPDGGVRVSARQPASIFSTAVAAMALGGRALPVAAGRIIAPVRAPRIVRRAPANGDVVRGVLSVQYTDEAGGTGIDAAQTRITVNGVDYTARARITPYTLQIRAAVLPRGTLKLHATVRDRAGHATTADWSVVGAG
jgi:hypothetical protein